MLTSTALMVIEMLIVGFIDVQATVNPIPHTAVNRTSSGFTGYTVMMFFFGFVWGIVNMLVTGAYLSQAFKVPAKNFAGVLFFVFNLFVSIPLFILFTIMPFFGGWIVVPIVQQVSLAVTAESALR